MSDLEELYQSIILDHNRRPKNYGSLEQANARVTGTVRVKLYKGNIYTAGRKSPVSLYTPQIATMEADPTEAYNQDDATGFIRLSGLRLRVNATVHGGEPDNTK